MSALPPSTSQASGRSMAFDCLERAARTAGVSVQGHIGAGPGQTSPQIPLKVGLRASAEGEGPDWVSPLAMALTPDQGPALARAIASQLSTFDEIAKAVARGGFIEFSFTAPAWADTITMLREMAIATRPRRPEPAAGWDFAAKTGMPWVGGPNELALAEPSLASAALAYSRARSQLRNAAAHRIQPATPSQVRDNLATILGEPHLRSLLTYADLLRSHHRADVITALLPRAATAYLNWFAATRATPRAAEPVTCSQRIRLAITEATAAALAVALARLGLTAPEHW